MPYIEKEVRKWLVTTHKAENPGELNWQISTLIRDYFVARGNYAAINDVLGALEGAKLEFYRRVAVPYEDLKIKENGDIYP